MMKTLTAILSLLLALPASGEVVDAILGSRTGSNHIYRAAESRAPFENDDAFTICTFFNSGNTGQNTVIAMLSSDGDLNNHLAGIRHSNTGILQIRDNFNNLDEAVAAVSQNTWYAACLRSAGTGSMTLSYYNSSGTLIEDLTGTDTNDPNFGTPDEMRIVFGGLYRANTDDTIENLENGVALMSIWTSDIGDSGADTYASDPLNYTGTTNPPNFFKAHNNTGDITISTTLQDQSGNGKHFTLAGDAALSNEGGPTVADFATEDNSWIRRRR